MASDFFGGVMPEIVDVNGKTFLINGIHMSLLIEFTD
jgi:hypothetical protein